MSMDYSIYSLVVGASPVVKAVMGILAIMSLLSWTFIFQRWFVLQRARKFLSNFTSRIEQGSDFDKLFEYSSAKKNFAEGFELVLREGFREYSRLLQHGCHDPKALLEGAERSMFVAISREQNTLEKHLSFLATVGSISPYIGLFGTVWGIMASLKSLGTVAQATLSMVAPGISEALIATAMGLLAAIPAWFAYNRYTSLVQNIINEYQILAEDCLTFLHRKSYSRTVNKSAKLEQVEE